jgi:hypothetical protein
MVMFFNADLARLRKAPADYADMACMSYMVFSYLLTPGYDAISNTWKCGGDLLFQEAEYMHWTEHSERNVVNNYAATLGIGKSEGTSSGDGSRSSPTTTSARRSRSSGSFRSRSLATTGGTHAALKRPRS